MWAVLSTIMCVLMSLGVLHRWLLPVCMPRLLSLLLHRALSGQVAAEAQLHLHCAHALTLEWQWPWQSGGDQSYMQPLQRTDGSAAPRPSPVGGVISGASKSLRIHVVRPSLRLVLPTEESLCERAEEERRTRPVRTAPFSPAVPPSPAVRSSTAADSSSQRNGAAGSSHSKPATASAAARTAAISSWVCSSVLWHVLRWLLTCVSLRVSGLSIAVECGERRLELLLDLLEIEGSRFDPAALTEAVKQQLAQAAHSIAKPVAIAGDGGFPLGWVQLQLRVGPLAAQWAPSSLALADAASEGESHPLFGLPPAATSAADAIAQAAVEQQQQQQKQAVQGPPSLLAALHPMQLTLQLPLCAPLTPSACALQTAAEAMVSHAHVALLSRGAQLHAFSCDFGAMAKLVGTLQRSRRKPPGAEQAATDGEAAAAGRRRKLSRHHQRHNAATFAAAAAPAAPADPSQILHNACLRLSQVCPALVSLEVMRMELHLADYTRQLVAVAREGQQRQQQQHQQQSSSSSSGAAAASRLRGSSSAARAATVQPIRPAVALALTLQSLELTLRKETHAAPLIPIAWPVTPALHPAPKRMYTAPSSYAKACFSLALQHVHASESALDLRPAPVSRSRGGSAVCSNTSTPLGSCSTLNRIPGPATLLELGPLQSELRLNTGTLMALARGHNEATAAASLAGTESSSSSSPSVASSSPTASSENSLICSLDRLHLHATPTLLQFAEAYLAGAFSSRTATDIFLGSTKNLLGLTQLPAALGAWPDHAAAAAATALPPLEPEPAILLPPTPESPHSPEAPLLPLCLAHALPLLWSVLHSVVVMAELRSLHVSLAARAADPPSRALLLLDVQQAAARWPQPVGTLAQENDGMLASTATVAANLASVATAAAAAAVSSASTPSPGGALAAAAPPPVLPTLSLELSIALVSLQCRSPSHAAQLAPMLSLGPLRIATRMKYKLPSTSSSSPSPSPRQQERRRRRSTIRRHLSSETHRTAATPNLAPALSVGSAPCSSLVVPGALEEESSLDVSLQLRTGTVTLQYVDWLNGAVETLEKSYILAHPYLLEHLQNQAHEAADAAAAATAAATAHAAAERGATPEAVPKPSPLLLLPFSRVDVCSKLTVPRILLVGVALHRSPAPAPASHVDATSFITPPRSPEPHPPAQGGSPSAKMKAAAAMASAEHATSSQSVHAEAETPSSVHLVTVQLHGLSLLPNVSWKRHSALSSSTAPGAEAPVATLGASSGLELLQVHTCQLAGWPAATAHLETLLATPEGSAVAAATAAAASLIAENATRTPSSPRAASSGGLFGLQGHASSSSSLGGASSVDGAPLLEVGRISLSRLARPRRERNAVVASAPASACQAQSCLRMATRVRVSHATVCWDTLQHCSILMLQTAAEGLERTIERMQLQYIGPSKPTPKSAPGDPTAASAGSQERDARASPTASSNHTPDSDTSTERTPAQAPLRSHAEGVDRTEATGTRQSNDPSIHAPRGGGVSSSSSDDDEHVDAQAFDTGTSGSSSGSSSSIDEESDSTAADSDAASEENGDSFALHVGPVALELSFLEWVERSVVFNTYFSSAAGAAPPSTSGSSSRAAMHASNHAAHLARVVQRHSLTLYTDSVSYSLPAKHGAPASTIAPPARAAASAYASPAAFSATQSAPKVSPLRERRQSGSSRAPESHVRRRSTTALPSSHSIHSRPWAAPCPYPLPGYVGLLSVRFGRAEIFTAASLRFGGALKPPPAKEPDVALQVKQGHFTLPWDCEFGEHVEGMLARWKALKQLKQTLMAELPPRFVPAPGEDAVPPLPFPPAAPLDLSSLWLSAPGFIVSFGDEPLDVLERVQRTAALSDKQKREEEALTKLFAHDEEFESPPPLTGKQQQPHKEGTMRPKRAGASAAGSRRGSASTLHSPLGSASAERDGEEADEELIVVGGGASVQRTPLRGSEVSMTDAAGAGTGGAKPPSLSTSIFTPPPRSARNSVSGNSSLPLSAAGAVSMSAPRPTSYGLLGASRPSFLAASPPAVLFNVEEASPNHVAELVQRSASPALGGGGGGTVPTGTVGAPFGSSSLPPSNPALLQTHSLPVLSRSAAPHGGWATSPPKASLACAQPAVLAAPSLTFARLLSRAGVQASSWLTTAAAQRAQAHSAHHASTYCPTAPPLSPMSFASLMHLSLDLRLCLLLQPQLLDPWALRQTTRKLDSADQVPYHYQPPPATPDNRGVPAPWASPVNSPQQRMASPTRQHTQTGSLSSPPPPPAEPTGHFVELWGRELVLDCTRVLVRVRDYPVPLLSTPVLTLQGLLIAGQMDCPEPFLKHKHMQLMPGIKRTEPASVSSGGGVIDADASSSPKVLKPRSPAPLRPQVRVVVESDEDELHDSGVLAEPMPPACSAAAATAAAAAPLTERGGASLRSCEDTAALLDPLSLTVSSSSRVPLKFYHDLTLSMTRAHLTYGPCLLYALEALSACVSRLSAPKDPTDPMPNLAWWTKLRYVVQGRFRARLEEMDLRLLTNVQPYVPSYLHLSGLRWALDLSGSGALGLSVTDLSAAVVMHDSEWNPAAQGVTYLPGAKNPLLWRQYAQGRVLFVPQLSLKLGFTWQANVVTATAAVAAATAKLKASALKSPAEQDAAADGDAGASKTEQPSAAEAAAIAARKHRELYEVALVLSPAQQSHYVHHEFVREHHEAMLSGAHSRDPSTQLGSLPPISSVFSAFSSHDLALRVSLRLDPPDYPCPWCPAAPNALQQHLRGRSTHFVNSKTNTPDKHGVGAHHGQSPPQVAAPTFAAGDLYEEMLHHIPYLTARWWAVRWLQDVLSLYTSPPAHLVPPPDELEGPSPAFGSILASLQLSVVAHAMRAELLQQSVMAGGLTHRNGMAGVAGVLLCVGHLAADCMMLGQYVSISSEEHSNSQHAAAGTVPATSTATASSSSSSSSSTTATSIGSSYASALPGPPGTTMRTLQLQEPAMDVLQASAHILVPASAMEGGSGAGGADDGGGGHGGLGDELSSDDEDSKPAAVPATPPAASTANGGASSHSRRPSGVGGASVGGMLSPDSADAARGEDECATLTGGLSRKQSLRKLSRMELGNRRERRVLHAQRLAEQQRQEDGGNSSDDDSMLPQFHSPVASVLPQLRNRAVVGGARSVVGHGMTDLGLINFEDSRGRFVSPFDRPMDGKVAAVLGSARMLAIRGHYTDPHASANPWEELSAAATAQLEREAAALARGLPDTFRMTVRLPPRDTQWARWFGDLMQVYDEEEEEEHNERERRAAAERQATADAAAAAHNRSMHSTPTRANISAHLHSSSMQHPSAKALQRLGVLASEVRRVEEGVEGAEEADEQVQGHPLRGASVREGRSNSISGMDSQGMLLITARTGSPAAAQAAAAANAAAAASAHASPYKARNHSVSVTPAGGYEPASARVAMSPQRVLLQASSFSASPQPVGSTAASGKTRRNSEMRRLRTHSVNALLDSMGSGLGRSAAEVAELLRAPLPDSSGATAAAATAASLAGAGPMASLAQPNFAVSPSLSIGIDESDEQLAAEVASTSTQLRSPPHAGLTPRGLAAGASFILASPVGKLPSLRAASFSSAAGGTRFGFGMPLSPAAGGAFFPASPSARSASSALLPGVTRGRSLPSLALLDYNTCSFRNLVVNLRVVWSAGIKKAIGRWTDLTAEAHPSTLHLQLHAQQQQKQNAAAAAAAAAAAGEKTGVEESDAELSPVGSTAMRTLGLRQMSMDGDDPSLLAGGDDSPVVGGQPFRRGSLVTRRSFGQASEVGGYGGGGYSPTMRAAGSLTPSTPMSPTMRAGLGLTPAGGGFSGTGSAPHSLGASGSSFLLGPSGASPRGMSKDMCALLEEVDTHGTIEALDAAASGAALDEGGLAGLGGASSSGLDGIAPSLSSLGRGGTGQYPRRDVSSCWLTLFELDLLRPQINFQNPASSSRLILSAARARLESQGLPVLFDIEQAMQAAQDAQAREGGPSAPTSARGHVHSHAHHTPNASMPSDFFFATPHAHRLASSNSSAASSAISTPHSPHNSSAAHKAVARTLRSRYASHSSGASLLIAPAHGALVPLTLKQVCSPLYFEKKVFTTLQAAQTFVVPPDVDLGGSITWVGDTLLTAGETAASNNLPAYDAGAGAPATNGTAHASSNSELPTQQPPFTPARSMPLPRSRRSSLSGLNGVNLSTPFSGAGAAAGSTLPDGTPGTHSASLHHTFHVGQSGGLTHSMSANFDSRGHAAATSLPPNEDIEHGHLFRSAVHLDGADAGSAPTAAGSPPNSLPGVSLPHVWSPATVSAAQQRGASTPAGAHGHRNVLRRIIQPTTLHYTKSQQQELDGELLRRGLGISDDVNGVVTWIDRVRRAELRSKALSASAGMGGSGGKGAAAGVAGGVQSSVIVPQAFCPSSDPSAEKRVLRDGIQLFLPQLSAHMDPAEYQTLISVVQSVLLSLSADDKKDGSASAGEEADFDEHGRLLHEIPPMANKQELADLQRLIEDALENGEGAGTAGTGRQESGDGSTPGLGGSSRVDLPRKGSSGRKSTAPSTASTTLTKRGSKGAQVKSIVQYYLGVVSWEMLRGTGMYDSSTAGGASHSAGQPPSAAGVSVGRGFISASLHGLFGDHEFRSDLSRQVHYQIRELHLKSLMLSPQDRNFAHYQHLVRPEHNRWKARDLKRDMMVRVRALVREPLSRVHPRLHYVTAFEHFEVTTFPLVVCLPHDHALMLRDYFLPEALDQTAAKVKAEAEAKFTQKKSAAEAAAAQAAQEKVRRTSVQANKDGADSAAENSTQDNPAGSSSVRLLSTKQDLAARKASAAGGEQPSSTALVLSGGGSGGGTGTAAATAAAAAAANSLHESALHSKERALRLAERRKLIPSIKYFKYLRLNEVHFTFSFRHKSSALFTFENVHLRIGSFTRNKCCFAPAGWSALVTSIEKHVVYAVIKHGTEILAQKMGLGSIDDDSAGGSGSGITGGPISISAIGGSMLDAAKTARRLIAGVGSGGSGGKDGDEESIDEVTVFQQNTASLLGAAAAARSTAVVVANAAAEKDRLVAPASASPSPLPPAGEKRASLGKRFLGALSRVKHSIGGGSNESEEERAARKAAKKREKEEAQTRKLAERSAKLGMGPASRSGSSSISSSNLLHGTAVATPPRAGVPGHAHAHSYAPTTSAADALADIAQQQRLKDQLEWLEQHGTSADGAPAAVSRAFTASLPRHRSLSADGQLLDASNQHAITRYAMVTSVDGHLAPPGGAAAGASGVHADTPPSKSIFVRPNKASTTALASPTQQQAVLGGKFFLAQQAAAEQHSLPHASPTVVASSSNSNVSSSVASAAAASSAQVTPSPSQQRASAPNIPTRPTGLLPQR